jgi:hypothetical protein
MDKKILFIGDSWVTNLFLNNTRFILGKPHYSSTPIYRFWDERGYVPYFIGDSSRDTQTIIDIWTKYIPYLSEEDLLVIFLPTFNRTRLPKFGYGTLHGNENFKDFNSFFIGSKSYNQKDVVLEMWGNTYDYEYFTKKLEFQELINISNASILNHIDVIDSLYKMSPCKKIIHCWDYKKFDSDVIVYREEMTELIGMWETRGDVHERTNGEQETQGDGHWSDNMNMKFMELLMKHFNIH